MRRTPILLLAAPCLAVATGCAHRSTADEHAFIYSDPGVETTISPPPVASAPAEITRYADENRDGKVTKKEAEADPNLARVFDEYDVDDSGDLDRGEFARLEDQSRERRAESTVPASTTSREMTVVPMPLAEDSAGAPSGSLNRTGIDEIRSAPER